MATFGHVTLSGTSVITVENKIVGGFFSMGAVGGTADSITAKFYISDAAKLMRCALYDSDSNLVANGVTEEISVPVGTAIERTFNFEGTKPILIADASYFLCVWSESAAGFGYLRFVPSGAIGVEYDNETYNNFPDTLSLVVHDSTAIPAIYCTYTEVGGVEHTHSASDTLAISDSLAVAANYKVALADTLGIGDSLATPVMQFNVPLSDTLSMSDALTSAVMEFKVALADTLSMSDLLSVAATYNVELADTLAISDSLSPAAQYVVALADTLEISDSLAAEIVVIEIRRRVGLVRKVGLPTAQNVGLGM